MKIVSPAEGSRGVSRSGDGAGKK